MAEWGSHNAEGHHDLKRWEKKQQYLTLQKDDAPGPLAVCKYRESDDATLEWIYVHVIKVFRGDLICVKAYKIDRAYAAAGAYWLVREALDWPSYLASIIRAYRAGNRVPIQFQPLRKIPPPLMSQLEDLPPQFLQEAFQKMRDHGFLATLPVLSKETCPSQLQWNSIKAGFQDFKSKQKNASKIPPEDSLK